MLRLCLHFSVRWETLPPRVHPQTEDTEKKEDRRASGEIFVFWASVLTLAGASTVPRGGGRRQLCRT